MVLNGSITALKDSSLALILSDHNEFKNIDFNILINNMNKSIVFDTKNIIKKDIPQELTFFNYGNLFSLNE